MAGKTELRRDRLRETLLEIAERRIAENGYRALTARELAAEAGCAVGAIYNIFKDMDALVAAMNTRTGARLERAVAEAFAKNAEAGTPKRQLVLLGRTYLAFVVENPLLWSAIFEQSARLGKEFAEKREAENTRLVGHIVRPLKVLLPGAGEERLALVARALFAAVHGIVSLGFQRRFLAESPKEAEEQIVFIVEAFCDGAALQKG
ncbi:TetR/AcrR family transcriptional regulator [Mesorhizobium sp. LHD-90]|uniref:TetR/AcrR family transcriptional regulator n=1 Tax=Mesorhizobium sp. LHD-90 TaxID=3071414 RepID=UPI0027DFE41A|nr:TetR/AcrR family transcriptional regulator [Mesorhizobium sp. LHD-90]MDQ6432787.1 TetR/AcrR family transcriptional regulator [Mesorhizobium sp. LHD-90]